MQFNHVEIGEKILPEVVEEGYYVTINYMYESSGDVDRTWGPFYKGEEKSLLRFVNMLERTLKAFPNGKGGFDEFQDKVPELKEWNRYFDENKKYRCKDCKKKCEKCKVPEVRLNFKWETEPNGYYTQADIISYDVQYYNPVNSSYYQVILSKKERNE